MLYAKGILLDSGALYALADSRDGKHQEARTCLEQIQKGSLPVFISNVTIYESYRLILHKLGIKKALEFLNEIYDGALNIAYITEEDENKAKEYLKKYDDQPFTYVDALNFAIMGRIRIFKVFSFDKHFNIIGFIKIPPYY